LQTMAATAITATTAFAQRQDIIVCK